MSSYLTICDNVCRAMGDLGASGLQSRAEEVKPVVNMVYLNEILCCDPLRSLFWLRYLDDSIKSKVADTIVSISKATTAAMVTNFDWATGDILSLYSVTGMSEMNYRAVRLTRTSAKNYTLADLKGTAIDSSGFVSAATGGTLIHRGKVLTNKVKSIISVNWQGYSKRLDPISEKELEDSPAWWDSGKSRPTHFQHLKYCSAAGVESDLLLWFYGADATYNMRLWQEISPDPLSAPTDVPLLPPQFHSLIEAGAITRLGENKVQVEAGVVWPEIYKMGLQALVNYNAALWKQYDEKRSRNYMQ